MINNQFIPKINCRFKVRRDINGFLGFFQGKGVLALNEIGAYIVSQMTGEKSLQEIEKLVREAFPLVNDPVAEVIDIAVQLKNAGFL